MDRNTGWPFPGEDRRPSHWVRESMARSLQGWCSTQQHAHPRRVSPLQSSDSVSGSPKVGVPRASLSRSPADKMCQGTCPFRCPGTSATSPHPHLTPASGPRPVVVAQTNGLRVLSGSKRTCRPTAVTCLRLRALPCNRVPSTTGQETSRRAGSKRRAQRVARRGPGPGFGEAAPLCCV